MKKIKILTSLILLILFFHPYNLMAVKDENDELYFKFKKKEQNEKSNKSFLKSNNRDYVSLQLYFVDYYSKWAYFKFRKYDEYFKEYFWEHNKYGCIGGYLELNIGLCWKHFFSRKIFGELSLTTGIYSLEKSSIYETSTEEFTRIRIRPLEYIAQVGLGYCFFQSKRVYVFTEVSGSLNGLRAWPSDATVLPEQVRGLNFAWRGEFGVILHLSKKSFIEMEVGLFVNSNYYHNTGHQVRVGIGKIFN